MNKYMISVDWLQVYCRYKNIEAIQGGARFQYEGREFEVKAADIQTAMFKTVANVYDAGIEVATIQHSPRSSKLDARIVLLKLSNRVLYHAKFVRLLYALIDGLELSYMGITRIDVCYDCVRFAGNRSPSRFINEFVSKRTVSAHDIRKKGSEEFTCHGKKPRGGAAKINYIRFGSPQSKISAYIYDKTLELEEVHNKPWIREAWKKAGLTPTSEHIFRSEISIKAEGTDLLNMSTGELFRLSPDMLESQIKVESLFAMYAKKYLSFSLDAGQKNKKDFKQIQLFEYEEKTDIKPIQINRCADTGRIEKICYNVLERLSSTYTDVSEYHRSAIEGTQRFLKEVGGMKSAKARAESYMTYLNRLKAYQFSDVHFNEYLDTLVKSHELEIAILQSSELRDSEANARLF